MGVRPRSIATRVGAITGVALGVLSLPVIALARPDRLFGVGPGLSALFFIVALIVFAVAGFLATRRNGLIRSGVWAGFLAGLIAAFLGVCLGAAILTVLAPSAALAGVVARRAGRGLRVEPLRLALIRLTLGEFALALAGLVAGLIGGLLGRIGWRNPNGPTNGAADGRQFAPASGTPPYPNSAAPGQGSYAGYGAYPPAPTPTPAPRGGEEGYTTPLTPGAPVTTGAQQPYYPPAPPYDGDAPTTIREREG